MTATTLQLNFRASEDLVKMIDEKISAGYARTRSEYVRDAVKWRLGLVGDDESEWSNILHEGMKKKNVRDMFKEIIEEIILEHDLV